ncbi:hypothetical protein PISL3812_03006 [Talaromyces islandicus]|uniref:Uncharacterized protein n=1 Tax=Talaromyces islandicus TaxID=28573 RepID=A0A0U1LRG9_TALIS|nr:hypothetical protein PISL3812_03006 [Talaromyces islandicus]
MEGFDQAGHDHNHRVMDMVIAILFCKWQQMGNFLLGPVAAGGLVPPSQKTIVHRRSPRAIAIDDRQPDALGLRQYCGIEGGTSFLLKPAPGHGKPLSPLPKLRKPSQPYRRDRRLIRSVSQTHFHSAIHHHWLYPLPLSPLASRKQLAKTAPAAPTGATSFRADYITTPSSRPRRAPSTEYDSARDHLASLIKKHGPPTPVSSTSSLRRLTSTSPISTSFLPPTSPDTPPASPTSVDVESPYVSTAGSQPIPIPRNPTRSLEDLPLTPLTGRFDHGLYLSERPSKSLQSTRTRHSRDDKPARKKKTRPAEPPVSSSTPAATTARSPRSKRMPHSQGPSLTMSPQSGQASPKQSPKDSPMYLGNLPRFHPAAYQSPNSPSNTPLSPTTNNQQRSFAYRVSSSGSRDALRQYRELVAASVSLSRNAPSGRAEISAPRLDPLGSPGPVTPLALEDADSYVASRPGGLEDKSSQRKLESVPERDRVASRKDGKGR